MTLVFLRFLRRFARVTLVSYAEVLLSSSPLAGLLFLAASFATYPLGGAAGLAAVVAANLFGFFLSKERIRWELGLSGYNAVMLGLAIAYYLPNKWWMFALAIAAGITTAWLTESLNRRVARYSLPVLGLPFLIVGWVILGGVRPWALPSPKPPFEFLHIPLHGFLANFMHYLGSVYYSGTYLSGLLVLAGLLIASRISAAAALAGALLGALVGIGHHNSMSMSINLIIAPVGLVFFLAPNRALPFHVIAGMAMTLLFGLLLEPLFATVRLPMLILPLTMTLFIFLVAGRRQTLGRGRASRWRRPQLVPLRVLSSPETNLRIYRNRLREPLRLPFFGTWFVSQGIRGGETHRGRLAHAWDFMVRDEKGRTFVIPGYRLNDYHAYGLLVSAPASGRVVMTENSVEDNVPGKLNKEQNWGNWVVIEHSLLEYSILAHLQQGSVRVKPGDVVSAGTVVGTCGNSGYSGQPHLHYQLQTAPMPGSDALPARFRNYLVLSAVRGRDPNPSFDSGTVPPAKLRPSSESEQDEGRSAYPLTFVREGEPGQGETVQPLAVQEEIRSLLAGSFQNDMSFEIRAGGQFRVVVARQDQQIVLRAGTPA